MSSAWDSWLIFFDILDSWPTIQFKDFDSRPFEYLISLEMALCSAIGMLLIAYFIIVMMMSWSRRYISISIWIGIWAGANELILKQLFKQPRPELSCTLINYILYFNIWNAIRTFSSCGNISCICNYGIHREAKYWFLEYCYFLTLFTKYGI